MKKKSITPLLGQVLQKIAPQIGATVVMEPEWNVVGQIIFKSGRKRYFRYSSLDLNPLGASEISKDKDYSNFFMEKLGYPIVPGSKTFYSEQWGKTIGAHRSRTGIESAWKHAQKLGLPVIVKPNSGSQGVGVSLVHNKLEFYMAMRFVFTKDRIALIQSPVKGRDYRVVVLDKKVISAYERIPLSVLGDGKSSIMKLLKAKQKNFIASSRDTRIKTNDPRMVLKLKHQGLSFKSIPSAGIRVFLLDNANLSTGGDSIDVTEQVHQSFRKIAVKLTEDMGLRLCGVDLMIEGDITQTPGTWWVLEINSAPGLDHYARSGKVQEQIVENLYLEVLKSMEK